MKRTVSACVLLLGCFASIPGRTAGRLAEVAVIDGDTGQQLEAYYRRGEYWVAGEPGARYAISVRNHTGERLLAVMSVDGVNAITGQTAGWDQGGYVLDPWESYQVTGWRKSDYQVAAFAFTAAPQSYAVRTGRPDNVGVIGIALFRERLSAPLPPSAPPIARGGRDEAAPRLPSGSGQAQSAPAAGALGSESGFSDREASADAIGRAPLARAPALGTAHGEREYSYVAHTSFVRRQSRPDEIVRIRYDRLDNLIAMGIVRPHRHPGERPDPFPSTASGYVPDPPPVDAALVR